MRTVVLLCCTLLCGVALSAFLLRDTDRSGATPGLERGASTGRETPGAADQTEELETAHGIDAVGEEPQRQRLPEDPAEGADPAQAAAVLIASGRVVDSSGLPVEGARVAAHVVTGSDVLMVVNVGKPGVTRSDGRFFLTEEKILQEASKLYLDAAREGFIRAKEVLIARGERDVEILLQRPGVLRGRWLRSAEIPGDVLRVRVENEQGELVQDSALADTSDEHISLVESEGGTGSFTLRNLAPGSYSVSFVVGTASAAAESRALARVDAVVVREGETTRDARLDPIDLRGLTRAFVLDVRAPDERRPSEVRLQSRSGDSTYWAECEPLRLADGRFILFTTEPALDLLLAVDGYRDEALEDVRSNRTILLRRGIDARVSIADMPALPPDFTLYIDLVPRDSAYEVVGARSVVLPDGSARFALPRPGRYTASPVLTRAGENDTGDLEIALSDEIEFEVLEQEALQEFRWPGVDGSIFETLQGAQQMR